MTPSDHPRFDALLRRVLDADPDAMPPLADLEAALRDEPGLVDEYLAQVEIDSLLAWELGSGFGHVYPLGFLADALRELAARELNALVVALTREGLTREAVFRLLQLLDRDGLALAITLLVVGVHTALVLRSAWKERRS